MKDVASNSRLTIQLNDFTVNPVACDDSILTLSINRGRGAKVERGTRKWSKLQPDMKAISQEHIKRWPDIAKSQLKFLVARFCLAKQCTMRTATKRTTTLQT